MLLSFTALLILVFLLPQSRSHSGGHEDIVPEVAELPTQEEPKSTAPDSVFTEKSATFADPLTEDRQKPEEKGD